MLMGMAFPFSFFLFVLPTRKLRKGNVNSQVVFSPFIQSMGSGHSHLVVFLLPQWFFLTDVSKGVY